MGERDEGKGVRRPARQSFLSSIRPMMGLCGGVSTQRATRGFGAVQGQWPFRRWRRKQGGFRTTECNDLKGRALETRKIVLCRRSGLNGDWPQGSAEPGGSRRYWHEREIGGHRRAGVPNARAILQFSRKIWRDGASSPGEEVFVACFRTMCRGLPCASPRPDSALFPTNGRIGCRERGDVRDRGRGVMEAIGWRWGFETRHGRCRRL